MKYKRITRKAAIEYLKNSSNGNEPVWFKTNKNTPSGVYLDKIYVNGKWISVYGATDAGKVCFLNGKNDIYGYEECKVAYVCNN